MFHCTVNRLMDVLRREDRDRLDSKGFGAFYSVRPCSLCTLSSLSRPPLTHRKNRLGYRRVVMWEWGEAFQHSLPSFQESRKSLFAYTISFPHHWIVAHCLAILIQYLFNRLPFISTVFVASTRMCLSSTKWGCFWEERMFWLVLTILEHCLRFRTWSWG